MPYKDIRDRHKYNKQYYKNTKHKGMCWRCRNTSRLKNKICCLECSKIDNQSMAKFRKKAKQKGLCQSCFKNIIDTKTLCRECLNKRKIIRDYRKQNRLCVGCGSKAVKNNTKCERCIIRNIIRESGIPLIDYNKVKRKLDKQNWICPYTGNKLIPGINLSLDHIIPSSRGGKNILNNLEWVELNVNIAKNSMRKNEFLMLCKSIVERLVNGKLTNRS